MENYLKLIASLNLNNLIGSCMSGEIACPMEGFEAPSYWYGFPPALIPIWSRGTRPKYLGIWKHWFVQRDISFVEMYVASGRMTYEVAKSSEQFFSYVILSAIVEEDGLTPEIEHFSKLVAIENLDDIDRISIETGDSPAGFTKLTQFCNNVPLNCVSDVDSYSGSFPVAMSSGYSARLETASEFEFPIESMEILSKIDRRPPWLVNTTESCLSLFKRYLAEGDFKGAWFALNSRGWSIKDARVAIQDLADAAKNQQFDLLVSAWLSIANNSVGGY
jgi:hypothetical protein